MNYAAASNFRDNHNARKRTAETFAPPVREFCGLDGATQRCRRNTKRQTQAGSSFHATDAFLKTTFLPKLNLPQTQGWQGDTGKLEEGFYTSLEQLAGFYQFSPLPVGKYPFPYNIALSLWDAESHLKENVRNWDGLRFVQERGAAFLETGERYGTGMVLYHIPVIPLFRMLNSGRRETAKLLLSVCAYLYHVADVPYYRQESSYSYWQYGMLSDWVEQDEDSGGTDTYKRELKQSEWVGDRMEKKLFNPNNLIFFKQRLDGLKITDPYDKECCGLAQDVFSLFTDYPNESIYRNIRRSDYSEEDMEVIGLEKYVSFIAEGSGSLYDNLVEGINNEFNEYGAIEEPLIQRSFNGQPLTENNLDFEIRLFSAMERLCYLLSSYKQTQK